MTNDLMNVLYKSVEADDPETIPLLMECLRSNHHSRVCFAALSIGRLANKHKLLCNSAVKELIDALSSDNQQVRKCALNTLMLLDVPLCYTSAITNIERGDGNQFIRVLAMKLIKSIMAQNSSDNREFHKNSSSTRNAKIETRNTLPFYTQSVDEVPGITDRYEMEMQEQSAIEEQEPCNAVKKELDFLEPENELSVNQLFRNQSAKNKNWIPAALPSHNVGPHEYEILDYECTKDISEPAETDEDAESLLRALNVSLEPEYLVSEDLWLEWSQRLTDQPIATQLIINVARDNDLPWPKSKEFESFDKYLGRPLGNVLKMLGWWKSKRTLLLCVANAVLKKPSGYESFSPRKEIHKVHKTSELIRAISFKELFRSDNPVDLLSNEIWNDWTNVLMNSDARTRSICDLVDELGSLFWQARWKNEKVSDYCNYTIDDISQIQYPGKNRTVVICMAKAATDILAKRDFRSPEVVVSPSRDNRERSAEIILGDLMLDTLNQLVWRAQQKIDLPSKEYSLLLYMVQNPNKVLTREMINHTVFESTIESHSNIIEVYINYLQKKIDYNFDIKLIHAVNGEGYILSERAQNLYIASENSMLLSVQQVEKDKTNAVSAHERSLTKLRNAYPNIIINDITGTFLNINIALLSQFNADQKSLVAIRDNSFHAMVKVNTVVRGGATRNNVLWYAHEHTTVNRHAIMTHLWH